MVRILCVFIFLTSVVVQAQVRGKYTALPPELGNFEKSEWHSGYERLSYKPVFAPFLALYQLPGRGEAYWQGLVITRTSPGKFFASTYFYDVQGNLRETRSYFNIKKRGQLTNWKIQIPSQHTSPVLVHTF
ncbi:MAG TPA: hypothetical protein VIH22_06925 [Cyclobacteriaceae bacterium]|jgi:hypothetical protein